MLQTTASDIETHG